MLLFCLLRLEIGITLFHYFANTKEVLETFAFFPRSDDVISVIKTAEISKVVASTIMTQTTPHSALSPITVATAAAQCLAVTLTTTTASTKMSTLPSPKKGKRHEDGWKEVVRRYLCQAK